jgi:hypothetical protein
MAIVTRSLEVTKYIYLTLEALFLASWLIALIVIQSRLVGVTDGFDLRLGHVLIGIHFLIPVSAIALSFDRADPDQELSILYYIAFFTVFGFDYYSVTESVWALRAPPGHEELVTLEVAMSSIAIGLTSFWFLWYAVPISMVCTNSRNPASRKSSSNNNNNNNNNNKLLL